MPSLSIRVLGAATALGALITMNAHAQAPGAQTPQQLSKPVTRTVQVGYLLYLPKDYGRDPAAKWPLMLFLHGAGESGTDLEKVKVHGPPKLLAQGKEFPFIVVSPQCPSPAEWWSTDKLITLLDDICDRYAVDHDRVYLTGLSMGGYGTWALACAQPERFAAIAPICGGGVPYRARSLKGMGVWAFHGAKDEVVPLIESERMVNSLKAAGGDAKLTVYPEAAHDSWTETYNNPELYAWLLSHKRSAPGGK
jgi:predicted peptidase